MRNMQEESENMLSKYPIKTKLKKKDNEQNFNSSFKFLF